VTRLLAIGYIVAAVAAALAWVVSRARPAHRHVALLLTFGLASDVVRLPLQAFVLAPAYAALHGASVTGWPRLAAHVDQAIFLAYPAGLAALTLWIYIGRRPWPVAIGYGLTEIGLIASYPAFRGEAIRKAYLGFQLTCLAVAIGAFLHWGVLRKNPPTVSHLVVGIMIVVEIASVAAGPWRFGFDNWDLAQLAYRLPPPSEARFPHTRSSICRSVYCHGPC
jgi:hypothetical protein